jgi:UDP-glucuronate decarboxylase
LPDVVYFISRISSPVAEIGALEENLNFLRSHINMITSITSIPKLVYLSSGAVYGRTEVDQNNSPFSESQRIDLGCLSDYARIKAESENLIETSFGSSSANYVLARLFAFYGPGLPLNDFAIGNFMASKIRKEPIQIKGDGRTVRSYMHVDDLSATLCRLATDGTGALNVGGRYPITLLELSELYKKLFGCPIEVLEQEDFESYYVPNISKIEKLLDKTNFISLEEGLQSWNKELEI